METLGAAEREAAVAEAAVRAARKRAEKFASPSQPRQRTVPTPIVVNIAPPVLAKEPSIKPTQDGFPAKGVAAPRIYAPRDRALLCVYATVAIDMLGSALTVPVMPFFVESLGGDASSLGILFSTFAIAQMAAGLWMGAASDRLGRRPILLVSLFGSAIGMLGSGLAPTYDRLLAWRFFLGSFSGTSSTANAYIADITNPSERPRLMSWIGVVASLCFMFGPGVGAGLSELDVRAPFYAGSIIGFAALVVAYFYLPPPEVIVQEQAAMALHHLASKPLSSSKDEHHPPPPSRRESMLVPEKTSWRLVTLVGVGSLLTTTASSSLMVCQALWLQEVFNFRSLQFGFVMMATSVVGLSLRTLAFDYIQRSMGLMRCAALGAVLSFLGYFGYSLIHLPPTFATRLAFFAVCAVAGTCGMILTSGSISPFLSRLAAKDTMGRVMSVASITSSAGRVIGPPLYGRLYMINHPLTYRVAATFAGTAAFAYLATAAAYARRLKRLLAKEEGMAEAMLAETAGAGAAQREEETIRALQDLLRVILLDRGYDLAANRLQLAAILENAFPFPESNDGCAPDKLLEEAVHHSASHHHHVYTITGRMGN